MNAAISALREGFEELRNFIVKFREKLADHVKIHDVYIVLDVLKENVLPEGVFEA